MNPTDKENKLIAKIFNVTEASFADTALEVFHFQYAGNAIYRQFCECIRVSEKDVTAPEQIPFLPVGFFKTHQVMTTAFEPEAIFESSGTSATAVSRHYVKDLQVYRESFIRAFTSFYHNPADWCIIALLPSYLERKNSSLVLMADTLIQLSKNPASGFYLHELEQLKNTLTLLESSGTKTLLIGVTFALLDFAEQYAMPLTHTIIMETGGMKGRRDEIVRPQVHEKICSSFGCGNIHSEYGMTELLSQAYSNGKGLFKTPAWMKILIREEDDPLSVTAAVTETTKQGAVNIIDLANIHSCSFIATDDAGKLYGDGSFEILGRLDHADIRGCSLLAL